jgi:hypothetical protein
VKVRGKPGVNLQLVVDFHQGRKHLPIVTLKRVAWLGDLLWASPRHHSALMPQEGHRSGFQTRLATFHRL